MGQDKYNPDVLRSWIDRLEDESNLTQELSVWEAGFIESVSAQLQRKGSLSERQVEILESIYTNKTK